MESCSATTSNAPPWNSYGGSAHRLEPRPDFKRRILQAFADGNPHRPDSRYGTINADVLAHFDPTFVRQDFVDVILNSGWPE
jgi:hypothetical protein